MQAPTGNRVKGKADTCHHATVRWVPFAKGTLFLVISLGPRPPCHDPAILARPKAHEEPNPGGSQVDSSVVLYLDTEPSSVEG